MDGHVARRLFSPHTLLLRASVWERRRWKVLREDQLAPDCGKVTHGVAAALR